MEAPRRIERTTQDGFYLVAAARFNRLEDVLSALLLNSVEEGASSVHIAWEDESGSMFVSDNGGGFPETVLRSLDQRRATSTKPAKAGQSLLLISSVARITIAHNGRPVLALGGQQGPFINREQTCVSVTSLFARTPVRLRTVDPAMIRPTVVDMAVAYPSVRYTVEMLGQVETVGPFLGRPAALRWAIGVPEEEQVVEAGHRGLYVLMVTVPASVRCQICLYNGKRFDDPKIRTAVINQVKDRGMLKNAHLATSGRFVTFVTCSDQPVVPAEKVAELVDACLDALSPESESSDVPDATAGDSDDVLGDQRPGHSRASILNGMNLFGNSFKSHGRLTQSLGSKEPRLTQQQRADIIPSMPSNPIDRVSLSDLTAVGQFADSFIVCSHASKLFFIDQHAAAERVNLELLLDELLAAKPIVVPRSEATPLRVGHSLCTHCGSGQIVTRVRRPLGQVTLDTPWLIDPVLARRSAYFERWGWRFDRDTVTAVPVIYGVILDRVAYLQDSLQDSGVPSIIHQIVLSRSCRMSIKANQPLTLADCAKVVADLADCRCPWYCAHGRPTIVPGPAVKVE
ncbi:DNA mismatch repair protein MLH3 [Carpediemonas membranifera]|uniref:DNA mismatch repair protein MLH3 n=1 Tax=Carpediemonas membranifera TaxID=201153 RepID=A0A8J6AYG8_9EUKA|nr:DNA mismatch repair protein MLH3 [Carpediemonas membranifera]|eukprot:KAG9390334.1 DNA mismatch repair protein MLH3 [Carpediemonas membranifera]